MGATGYGASRSWDSLLKGFATFSKMEMQLSPFLVCNFRYFYYATNTADEFILSQDFKMQAKIFRTMKLLEMKGPALREPNSKLHHDGIFEIRTKQEGNITRILYLFYGW